MEKCFVIQPFDGAKFDKRYRDIYEPAIRKANLEPYRIDQDPSTKIPITDIEKGIRQSAICFADITDNNPNVWYELGFAFACGRDVVMACSEERAGKLPFDIQHRHVLTYKNESTSDFKKLETDITTKIEAILKNAETIQMFSESPVAAHGLQIQEIAVLFCIAENHFTDDSISTYLIQSSMERLGFMKAATNIAIMTLQQQKYVEVYRTSNMWNNEEFYAVRLTLDGEKWLLTNQQLLKVKHDKASDKQNTDDLLF